MTQQIVGDMLIILTAGLLSCLICRRLRFSVLVGYLIAGVLIGKGGFSLIPETHDNIEHLAEAGVFLLLFTIGLEFSLSEVWKLRRTLLVGGAMQMLLASIPAYVCLRVSGCSWQASTVVAAAIAFSSTVLVFKSLTETGISGSGSGRRAIGILLFQDIALVPLLLLVPFLTGAGQVAGAQDWIFLVLRSAVFVFAIAGLRWFLPGYALPQVSTYRSLDLVVLLAIVCLTTVSFAAYKIGLPPAIGAFSAGLALSDNRWTKQIDALVLPFRETFTAFFFVSLGLLFDPAQLIGSPMLMLALLGGLLVTKGTAAAGALKITGLNWKQAIGLGLGLAHIGEFAFVLVLFASQSGVVTGETYDRVVTLAIMSLILAPMLLHVGSKFVNVEAAENEESQKTRTFETSGSRALVIGAGPIGSRIASHLETMGNEVCMIDLNPVNLYEFAQQGFNTLAGDATSDEVLHSAGATGAMMVVVCVPSDNVALDIVKQLKMLVPSNAQVLVRCRFQANVKPLQKSGATAVISEETFAAAELLKLLR